MEKAGKILMLTGAWVFCACVTDYKTVAPPTDLIVYVVSETGILLHGADVFAYDDTTAFNKNLSTGTPAGFVTTAQTVNGIATISKLEPDVSYYLYVLYKDQTLYPGTYVTYDNSTENFSLKNKLTQGSISYLNIVVKPTDGFITFWTASANSSILPLDIFYGTTAVGSISQGLVTVPSLFGTGALTLRSKKGAITFEGKSTAGCFWTSTIALAGAQSIFYQLQDCNVGTIAFFTDNTNSTKLPITLKLNANDALPNLTAIVSSVPANCSASNLIKSVRVPGNYTYEAISLSGNCIWTGSFTLTANQCKLIPLPLCP